MGLLTAVACAAALVGPRPAPAPEPIAGLVGEYGETLHVRESGGRLEAFLDGKPPEPLEKVTADVFRRPSGETLAFRREAGGRVVEVVLESRVLPRRTQGAVFRITPRRPVEELTREAQAARPPREEGPFLAADLVELVALDPSIRLDVRYATRDNFLGTPVYPAARAFLQRPAAEALRRAHRALRERGYGLLIHDAYRPWWVTKVFWGATPPDKHGFVADPAQGSRHNRGCAVDLTLYRLDVGSAVEMPGVYDEMSPRSAPDFPGGTALQRWHRDLLRAAMEAERFTVNPTEWWHFDFEDWRRYPILNLGFDGLGPGGRPPSP